ncbi:MAG TPA: flagellar basal body P-ring formation chaperone FlgA [Opitutaceae bacterium]|nr:flagellar basal body P-ring formation chaperone FlgA [Opitutaceae bacterium]
MKRLPLLLLSLIALATAVRGLAADTAEATRLSREEFIAAITRDLTGHFRLEGELQLELLRPWSAPEKTAAAWETVLLEYPVTASSSMMLRCRTLADGVPAGDFTLVVRATLWRDAWAARQPLALGAGFDPALLDARRVDFLRERDVLPASAGDRSYIIGRAVSAGRTLTWRDITRRPLVRKGETVEVSATYGQLLVTLKGVALESGAQGDSVSIRNPDSRKDFTATVIDENRVQVRF